MIRLRKRVRRRDQAGKPVGAGLGVNLRGRYIRMAEKRLQAAKVCAAIQHMCCETVPDHMRADPPRVDPGNRPDPFQRGRKLLARDMAVAEGKQIWRGDERLGRISRCLLYTSDAADE